MGRSEARTRARVLWLAGLTYGLLGLACLFPAWIEPRRHILGHWRHPDCLSNHWLFCWIADRIAGGQDLIHNDGYYHPVGDAPFLAGNGSDALFSAPFLWAMGWPAGLNVYYLAIVVGGCWGGFALCRAVGASRRASVAGGAIFGINPYVMAELSAGRLSQAPVLWLALFLAVFLTLLRRPGWGRAVLAGFLFAVNAFVYWYYGLFAVLAGAILLGGWLATHRDAIRRTVAPLGAFAITACGLLAWPLWVFASHWAEIPGTAEGSQVEIAVAGSLPLTWPLHDPAPADGTIVLSILSLVLAGTAVALGLRARDRGREGEGPRPAPGWLLAALVAIAVVFYLLALGPYPLLQDDPIARVPLPFRWLYGLAPPLERFWWPRRHSLLVFLAVAALAALAIDALGRRVGRRWVLAASVAVAVAAPTEVALRTGGNVVQVSLWEPPAAYRALAEAPGEVLLELPLDPRLVTNQLPLIYQSLHGKHLINGHASWVPRVRPVAWDAYVAGNTFLAALTRHELRQDGGTFSFDAADLRALQDTGLGVITVNREMYTYPLRDTYRSERRLMTELFGEPFLRSAYFEAFAVDRWTGATSVTLPGLAGPVAVPDSFEDNPLPGAPFPAMGFGSLNPRSLMNPLPVGDAPRQPKLYDEAGRSVRVDGARLQMWTPSEKVWMETPATEPAP